jgi:hypothetical protein
MNTYQSPYIDGQVVDAENVAGRSDGPLPVTQADAKISGCTKSASDCLHKTTKLAREFNHGTVSAAHLILAMTLIPNASRQFELRKMDIDRAFRAAMQALMEIERGNPSKGGPPGISEEFNVIVTLAQELAQNRDNQEVSVDDLLTALDRLPPDSAAAQLIRGERKLGSSAPDTQQTLDRLSLSIDQQFQEVRRLIDSLRFERHDEDMSRLKTYLQQRDGALEFLIGNGFSDIAGRLAAAPSSNPSEPVPQPGVTQADRPDEESLWDKIFGKKSADMPTPPIDGSSAQQRWGM